MRMHIVNEWKGQNIITKHLINQSYEIILF